jgi:hypothetical protein
VTALFLLFASHYYLVTLIDSSAGHEEVQFPSESVLDWWWKPILCLWVLAFWALGGGVLLSPLVLIQPEIFLVAWVLLLVLAYPLSLVSVLHTQNWLFVVHPLLLWRMLRHARAFAYVQLVTLLTMAACAGLLFVTLRYGLYWVIPSVIVIPAGLLFCARTWGRFTWLAVNFAPRKAKPARSEYMNPIEADPRSERVPTVDVEELDEPADGVREGLPPGYSHAIQAGIPASPDGVVAGLPSSALAAQEEDEWAQDKAPYQIVGEPGQPGLQEANCKSPQVCANATPNPSTPTVEEEEDEWSLDKKPYGLADEPAPSATHTTATAAIDKPTAVSDYYDKRAKREAAAKRKAQAQAESRHVPTWSKKTPTFSRVFLVGVAKFMIGDSTLRVAVNLALLTLVELVFLFMLVKFFPGI